MNQNLMRTHSPVDSLSPLVFQLITHTQEKPWFLHCNVNTKKKSHSELKKVNPAVL